MQRERQILPSWQRKCEESMGQARGKHGASIGKARASEGVFGARRLLGAIFAWGNEASKRTEYPFYNIKWSESFQL